MATIITKFNVGDTVLFIDGDGIKKEVVNLVAGEISEAGNKVYYYLGGKLNDCKIFKYEEQLFASKEEMIKHIETL